MNVYTCDTDGAFLVRAKFHKNSEDKRAGRQNKLIYKATQKCRTLQGEVHTGPPPRGPRAQETARSKILAGCRFPLFFRGPQKNFVKCPKFLAGFLSQMYTHRGKVHLRIDKRRARCYSAAITTKGDADMTARFENSFNMTGSCTRCNESCCASSSCAGNAAAMNTALLAPLWTLLLQCPFLLFFSPLSAL